MFNVSGTIPGLPTGIIFLVRIVEKVPNHDYMYCDVDFSLLCSDLPFTSILYLNPQNYRDSL